jgi:dTDP-4-amino-4,6-dideoxygalactose transaminase
MLMPSHPAHGNGDLSHLPVGRSVVDRILCLPIHEKISDAEVDRVAEAVTRFYGRPS